MLLEDQTESLHTHYPHIDCSSMSQCLTKYLSFLQRSLNEVATVTDQASQAKSESEVSGNHISTENFYAAYICHARSAELACILSNMELLPEDVAMVTREALQHFDNIFSDICSGKLILC